MGTIVLANKRIYPFGVENPVSGDDVPKIRIPRNFVPQQIVAVQKGTAFGASWDWSLRFDPDMSEVGAGTVLHSDTGVSNGTTGIVYDVGSEFPAVTIPAGDFLWLELENVTAGLFRPIFVLVEVHGVEKGS